MRLVVICGLLAPALLSAQLIRQPPVASLALRAEAPEAKVRPLEPIQIQALVYSEIEGEAQPVRVQRDGAAWSLPSGHGWLSKPFRYQGEEGEAFHIPAGNGLRSIIFREAAARFVLQDAVLYTAPAKEGVYTIEATLEGKTATLDITVTAEAPPRVPVEQTVFRFEPPETDPYHPLVAYWAPFVAQETWFQPKSDYIARFDLDGDWAGDNNWENAEIGSSQAYVYYSVMETPTHWFLIYNIFHPRDYSDKCVLGTCHENDNEGLILTVRKDGSERGRLEAMETLAHNNIYSHVADGSGIRNGAHTIDGRIELVDNRRPVVFIEAGGHGVYGSSGSHSRYVVGEDRFTAGTGVTYIYKGLAERPRHPDDRRVGYDLLPIWDHWWLRAHEGPGREERTFDSYFRYVPRGDRPRSAHVELAGAFFGVSEAENKAKPFWGWHDVLTRRRSLLATGQWGLDPAYAVTVNLSFPEPVSTEYLFNPYLGVFGGASAPGETGQ